MRQFAIKSEGSDPSLLELIDETRAATTSRFVPSPRGLGRRQRGLPLPRALRHLSPHGLHCGTFGLDRSGGHRGKSKIRAALEPSAEGARPI